MIENIAILVMASAATAKKVKIKVQLVVSYDKTQWTIRRLAIDGQGSY